jgi:hypothetical protein
MSGRILDFKSYIGGANNVIVEEMTPSVQKTFNYDYGIDVSLYTFAADMQTIVVDTLAYDRVTGDPNFADSTVLGSFANSEISSDNIIETDAVNGNIKFTIPAQRYTGQLLPDARNKVPITIISFRWTDTNVTPNVTEQHRYAILERYEPDVIIGDPTLDSNFLPIGVGAISTFSDNGTTDASRTAGTYTVTGIAGGDSEGFQVVVDGSGNATIDIKARGTKYITNDTIEILDSSLGGGGAADITITVTATV